MSQNEEVEELDTQVDSEVATDEENEQEGDTPSDDEITYEQALAWKASLEKANKKIAILSKWKKVEKTETIAKTADLSEDAIYDIVKRGNFYENNESAKELRKEIEAIVTASNWKIDRKTALETLSWDSEIEENRKVYGKSLVNGEKVSESWFNPISIDKYDKLSASEQKAYNDKSKAKNGWVVFK